jgi:hypothetical protein
VDPDASHQWLAILLGSNPAKLAEMPRDYEAVERLNNPRYARYRVWRIYRGGSFPRRADIGSSRAVTQFSLRDIPYGLSRDSLHSILKRY